jgi:hypothetical protein
MSKIGAPGVPTFTAPGLAPVADPAVKPAADTAVHEEAPRTNSAQWELPPPMSPDAQAQRAALLAQQAAASAPKQSYNDKYWASQPPEVQKLRTIQDPKEREFAAADLMARGFKIDMAIMSWGWDPEKTNNLRASYGYTWVPNAMQEPVLLAPGLSMPGTLKTYDPDNPPPGSIPVDTSAIESNLVRTNFQPAELVSMDGGPRPTDAIVQNSDGSSTQMEQSLLASRTQAAALRLRLQKMGFNDLQVSEQQPDDSAQTEWAGEDRRPYAIGNVNAGLMLQALAMYPEDDANRLIAGWLNAAKT